MINLGRDPVLVSREWFVTWKFDYHDDSDVIGGFAGGGAYSPDELTRFFCLLQAKKSKGVLCGQMDVKRFTLVDKSWDDRVNGTLKVRCTVLCLFPDGAGQTLRTKDLLLEAETHLAIPPGRHAETGRE